MVIFLQILTQHFLYEMQGQIISVQLHLSAQYTSICFYKIGDTTFFRKRDSNRNFSTSSFIKAYQSWATITVLVVKVFRLLIKYYSSFFQSFVHNANKTQLLQHINSNANSLFLEICIAWQAVIICILYHCIELLDFIYIYIILQSRIKS